MIIELHRSSSRDVQAIGQRARNSIKTPGHSTTCDLTERIEHRNDFTASDSAALAGDRSRASGSLGCAAFLDGEPDPLRREMLRAPARGRAKQVFRTPPTQGRARKTCQFLRVRQDGVGRNRVPIHEIRLSIPRSRFRPICRVCGANGVKSVAASLQSSGAASSRVAPPDRQQPRCPPSFAPAGPWPACLLRWSTRPLTRLRCCGAWGFRC
jgi:hypothetical protein